MGRLIKKTIHMSHHPSQEDVFAALDRDDAAIELLKLYQGYHSEIINSNIRINGDKKEEWNNIEIAINSGLDQLKSCNNITLYRNEPVAINEGKEQEFYNWFTDKTGKTISFPAFLSCYQFQERLPVKTGLIFKINTSNESHSKSLIELNPEHPEQEALYKSNSCFRIESCKISEDTCLVELSEIANQETDLIIYQNEQYYEWASVLNRTIM
ncbi:MAG: hypothetical protein N4A71_14900 [Carboxylicivirga sp.]|jgi:hypothetical protein|nr:hypothetical protein [Carboxylicivirga sp.]